MEFTHEEIVLLKVAIAERIAVLSPLREEHGYPNAQEAVRKYRELQQRIREYKP